MKKNNRREFEDVLRELVGESCPKEEQTSDMEETKEAIMEWQAMFYHFLDLSKLYPDDVMYREELSYIRRKIMELKLLQRNILALSEL